MKKSHLLKALVMSAVIIGSSIHTQAQTSGTVNLQVVITNFTSLVITGADQTATLTYLTGADYASGVSTSQTSALTAVSNQPYSITVLAATDLTLAGATIPVADVTVTPSVVGTPTGVSCTATPIPKTTAVQIVHSTVGTSSQAYNLAYTTVGAPLTDFFGKAPGIYASTLTYTITNP